MSLGKVVNVVYKKVEWVPSLYRWRIWFTVNGTGWMPNTFWIEYYRGSKKIGSAYIPRFPYDTFIDVSGVEDVSIDIEARVVVRPSGRPEYIGFKKTFKINIPPVPRQSVAFYTNFNDMDLIVKDSWGNYYRGKGNGIKLNLRKLPCTYTAKNLKTGEVKRGSIAPTYSGYNFSRSYVIRFKVPRPKEPKKYVVRIKVVDETGKPLQGVYVVVDGNGIGTTNKYGLKVVELKPGRHSFSLRLKGYYSKSFTIFVDKNMTLKQTLKKIPEKYKYTITVKVLDKSTNSPIYRAKVCVETTKGPCYYTDKTGVVRCPAPEYQTNVYVTKEGYEGTIIGIWAKYGLNYTAYLVKKKPAGFNVRVRVYLDGELVKEGTICMDDKWCIGIPPEGRVTFYNVSKGTHTFTYKGKYGTASATVNVTDHILVKINLKKVPKRPPAPPPRKPPAKPAPPPPKPPTPPTPPPTRPPPKPPARKVPADYTLYAVAGAVVTAVALGYVLNKYVLKR